MKHGFFRVAAAVPKVRVADCKYNLEKITDLVRQALEQEAGIIVFPELSLTAYTCGDLFHQEALIKAAEKKLAELVTFTCGKNIVVIAGAPVYNSNKLYNCAVIIQDRTILGVVPKSYIPNYKEFYEERWFSPGKNVTGKRIRLCGQDVPFGTDLVFAGNKNEKLCFSVEMCEDLWVPIPPSSFHALAGATLNFNLSASNDLIGKCDYRRNLVAQQSAKCVSGYIYTSCGIGESTTDVVFGGHAIIAEYGTVLAEGNRFEKDSILVVSDIDIEKLANDRLKNTSFMEMPPIELRKIVFFENRNVPYRLKRHIDPYPFVPFETKLRDKRCEEIFSIQITGLSKRMEYTGLKHAVIGISGGLDSTLALLVAAGTFDRLGRKRSDIIAVTMPGFGTTDKTYKNAVELMESMGVTTRKIDIKKACLQHFKDIGHNFEIHNVTYENVQARERTQILMDLATKYGGLVIGTGDLSEMALGWSTYNGDHMSMYAVNCSVPKTLVKYLVKWVAGNIEDEKSKAILREILNTPISPELLPPGRDGEIEQKTEDIVGPYELHDFFLYHMVRYGAAPSKILYLANHAFEKKYNSDTIKKWLEVFCKRFFSQQFKRSCVPDGPKVGSISLSPRGDWRMPSDASVNMWLDELQ